MQRMSTPACPRVTGADQQWVDAPMVEQDEHERTVRLPERRRLTANGQRTHVEEATVHCPLSQSACEVRQCQSCPRFHRELQLGGQDFVECSVPTAAAMPHDLCGEVMSAVATCLDSEMDALHATELLEIAGVTSAPVLDDNSVLVGVVSTASLARLRLESSQLHGFGYGRGPVEVDYNE